MGMDLNKVLWISGECNDKFDPVLLAIIGLQYPLSDPEYGLHELSLVSSFRHYCFTFCDY